MVQLVVMDIRARETGIHHDELRALKKHRSPGPARRGRLRRQPRHANYVENHTYQAYLADLRDRFDWPDPGRDQLPGASTQGTPTRSPPDHPAPR